MVIKALSTLMLSFQLQPILKEQEPMVLFHLCSQY